MKITSVKPLLIDQYIFCKIETNEGIYGIGESGSWAFTEASAAAMDRFARYLIGQNPLLIEHHWQYMYRANHFRGAAIMGALSAIDIALWDIKGKYYNAPVYELLGGKTRNKARVYYHTMGKDLNTIIASCKEAKKIGMTAVGHLSPFTDEPRSKSYFETFAQKIDRAVNNVAKYRETVGNDVDLCIEIHRQLSMSEAIALAKELEQFHPLFYEDPVRPDNFDCMEEVARAIHLPIATGERFHTPEEFAMIIKRNAAQFVRTDVCICGGITGAKKIAGMAEAFGINVVPHNPLGPVSTAACIQVAACIPNFTIQEFPTLESIPPKSEIIHTEVLYDGHGFLKVPDVPGIGVDICPDAERKYPYRPRPIETRLMTDGSVMDQ